MIVSFVKLCNNLRNGLALGQFIGIASFAQGYDFLMKMIVQADEQTDTPGLSRAKERVLNLNRSASRIVLAGLVLGFIFCMVAIPYFVRVSRRTPVVESMSPSRNELGVATNAPVRLTFNNKMRAGTINPSTFELRDDKDQIVPAQVEYRVSTRSVVLTPATAMQAGHTYEARVLGGVDGMKDSFGHPLPAGLQWRFTTGVSAPTDWATGPGGPILLITSEANHFTKYYAEILRNEGLNAFTVADASTLSEADLQQYDVAIVGELPLSDAQINMLSDWARAGGNLIAMRPGARMLNAMGVGSPDSSVADSPIKGGAYIAIDGKSDAGAGLVYEPIQIHGPVDANLTMCRHFACDVV